MIARIGNIYILIGAGRNCAWRIQPERRVERDEAAVLAGHEARRTRALAAAGDPAVTPAQIVWLPWSSGPVLQHPSRKNPVTLMRTVAQGKSRRTW